MSEPTGAFPPGDATGGAAPSPSPLPSSPAATPRRRLLRWRVVIPLAVVLALLIGGGFYVAANRPGQCDPSSGVRHGLSCDIPLPGNVTFNEHSDAPADFTASPPLLGGDEWSYTVSGTTIDQVHDFYLAQLPVNGWKCLKDTSHVVVRPSGLNSFIDASQTHKKLEVNVAPSNSLQGQGTVGDVELFLFVWPYVNPIDLSTCTTSLGPQEQPAT